MFTALFFVAGGLSAVCFALELVNPAREIWVLLWASLAVMWIALGAAQLARRTRRGCSAKSP